MNEGSKKDAFYAIDGSRIDAVICDVKIKRNLGDMNDPHQNDEVDRESSSFK